MLPFSEIHQDTVILKDGGLRGIIKVDGVNLDLKNPEEQVIVLEQYKRFLNGIDFPLQILVRNTYLDLTPYLNYVKANVSKVTHPNLKTQGNEYIKFLDNINLQQGLIFVKEFYLVVPFYGSTNDNEQVNQPWRNKILSALDGKDTPEKIVGKYRKYLKQKRWLDTRCNLVMDGMRALNMNAERLQLSDIVGLMFKCYNPVAQNSQAERDKWA